MAAVPVLANDGPEVDRVAGVVDRPVGNGVEAVSYAAIGVAVFAAPIIIQAADCNLFAGEGNHLEARQVVTGRRQGIEAVGARAAAVQQAAPANGDFVTPTLVGADGAVYAINNRGSSGYGKTFFKADDRVHGVADLDDVVESRKLLMATGVVDSARIGIIGGSYGGYMTLAALTFRPEAFEAGVDLFGISNWVRTLENIPPWWESFRDALYTEMGHPVEDRDALYAKSPLFHADSIRRPLMVLQGANDPRVLKVESDDIVDAVRRNGVPVEYVVFDDEGHGFVKKENQLRGYEAVLAFLDEYLKREQRLETVTDD